MAGQAPLTEGTPRIRAFFALPLPDAQRQALSRYLEACAAAAPDFRWASADNLHLTLRFAGSVDQSIVERVAQRLDLAAGPSFEVALGEIGTFRRGRLVRVVWLGVREGAERLEALAGLIETECRVAGLTAETRPFNPHLTLARARDRDGAPPPKLAPPPPLDAWMAREVILFSSHLGKGGARHEPIRRSRLAE